MTVAPPRAARLRAPSWRDPRLLVGVALVLGSVVLGTRVVAAADRTTPVWALAAPVAAGQAVRAGDLRPVGVRLDAPASGAYVPASTAPDGDWVALRTLAAGELLPRSALGSAAQLTARPVTVPLDAVPAGVEVGAQVDVWAAWPEPAGAGADPVPSAPAPEQLLSGAEVSAVSSGSGGLGARRSTDVQVLVPTEELPHVLAALTSSARLLVVPLPGSGAGS